jgi:hypothetical protein
MIILLKYFTEESNMISSIYLHLRKEELKEVVQNFKIKKINKKGNRRYMWKYE